MSWTESEINKRFPIWDALSEFWLDGWLDDTDCDQIAARLNDSPYSKEQLWAICVYEVAPAVSNNLLCVAGEWAGFNREWLCKAIIKKSSNPNAYLNPSVWRKFRGSIYDLHIKSSGWNKIAKQL